MPISFDYYELSLVKIIRAIEKENVLCATCASPVVDFVSAGFKSFPYLQIWSKLKKVNKVIFGKTGKYRVFC
jgi:hypothetical protein